LKPIPAKQGIQRQIDVATLSYTCKGIKYSLNEPSFKEVLTFTFSICYNKKLAKAEAGLQAGLKTGGH